MRIRQGNDFIFLWAIERNGEPENFSNAVNIRLHFKNFDCVGEVKSFQIVDGNIVRVEVSPEWASNLGAYRLILSYEFEDQSYSDGDQKCVVDVLAFNIVPKTSEADDITEMAKTTDIMIGLQGLSAYEVWLKDNPESTKEDYFNWLQKPATDIAETVNLQEQARVEAENTRKNNEEQRVTAETNRQNNFNSFIEVSESAVNTLIGTAQDDINEAISNAETATTNANNAASNADNARLAIQDDLALKANHGYDSSPKTLKEVDDEKADHGYASIDVAKTLKEVETDTSVKMANLIVNGDFSNGLTEWNATSNITVLNGIVSIDTASVVTLKQSLDIPANSVCYMAVRSQKIDGEATLRMALRKLDSTAVSELFDLSSSQGWLNESVLLTTNSNAEQLITQRLGVGGIVQLDFVILINLTETFGAGNEPTKEEMDLLISILGIEYFEGEITIPAQKIMQWQLALIRKNKNAIIVLGGTII